MSRAANPARLFFVVPAPSTWAPTDTASTSCAVHDSGCLRCQWRSRPRWTHIAGSPGPHVFDICGSCGTTDTCRTIQRVADTLAVYLSGPVLLDRFEARRHADAAINSAHNGRLVGVADISDGYVAWTAAAPYPARERLAFDDESVLIIDKRSGKITKWPVLPLDVLSKEYRRYLDGPGLA